MKNKLLFFINENKHFVFVRLNLLSTKMYVSTVLAKKKVQSVSFKDHLMGNHLDNRNC